MNNWDVVIFVFTPSQAVTVRKRVLLSAGEFGRHLDTADTAPRMGHSAYEVIVIDLKRGIGNGGLRQQTPERRRLSRKAHNDDRRHHKKSLPQRLADFYGMPLSELAAIMVATLFLSFAAKYWIDAQQEGRAAQELQALAPSPARLQEILLSTCATNLDAQFAACVENYPELANEVIALEVATEAALVQLTCHARFAEQGARTFDPACVHVPFVPLEFTATDELRDRHSRDIATLQQIRGGIGRELSRHAMYEGISRGLCLVCLALAAAACLVAMWLRSRRRRAANASQQ
ncbi:MAG: hypothetical protein ACPG1A_08560 [Halioglobus sp.]